MNVINTTTTPQAIRPSDAEMARAVERVIRQLPDLPAGSILAVISNHVVTLTGSTVWNYQRQAIGRLVEAIPRVAFVDNRVVLAGTAVTILV